jgi:hypothetical protein
MADPLLTPASIAMGALTTFWGFGNFFLPCSCLGQVWTIEDSSGSGVGFYSRWLVV